MFVAAAACSQLQQTKGASASDASHHQQCCNHHPTEPSWLAEPGLTRRSGCPNWPGCGPPLPPLPLNPALQGMRPAIYSEQLWASSLSYLHAMLQRTLRAEDEPPRYTQRPQATQHTSHYLLTLLGMASRLRLLLQERDLPPLPLGKRSGSPGRRCLSGCCRCRRRLPGAAGTAAGRPAGETVLCSHR